MNNGNIETISGDWGGQSGTEAHFASTSHVVNNGVYGGGTGYNAKMGIYLIGYAEP